MVTTPELRTELFTRSKELAQQWEKPHFRLAKYLDRLMGDARNRQTAAQVLRRRCPLEPSRAHRTNTRCMALRLI